MVRCMDSGNIKGKTKLTLLVEQEDAEKLLAALKEGKLADLGIVDVQLITPDDPSLGKWTDSQATKRGVAGPREK